MRESVYHAVNSDADSDESVCYADAHEDVPDGVNLLETTYSKLATYLQEPMYWWDSGCLQAELRLSRREDRGNVIDLHLVPMDIVVNIPVITEVLNFASFGERFDLEEWELDVLHNIADDMAFSMKTAFQFDSILNVAAPSMIRVHADSPTLILPGDLAERDGLGLCLSLGHVAFTSADPQIFEPVVDRAKTMKSA